MLQNMGIEDDSRLEIGGKSWKVEELHSGRVVKYAYDELHRLTAEEITDPVLGNDMISYSYDAFGNRLTKGGSGDTVTYSYSDNDELETESGLTYGYDDNGNAVGRDGVIFGYDYENRLVSAGSASYAYDADGIRVSSVSDGSATDYLVDKNRQYAQVLEERDDSGSVSYVYGDDLISRKQGGETRYYVYDGHGSVRQLTDADGAVTDSYIYDAFGNLRDHLGDSDNRYLYAGEQYDPASGLYYLRARYYGPESGRFMTHDPYPGNPGEPVTLHRYLYGNANPVSYVDPSGEFSIAEISTNLFFRSIIGAIAYSEVGHAIDFIAKEKHLGWKGGMLVVTHGNGWGGIGGIVIKLTSEYQNGKRAEGWYLLAMGGYTVSPEFMKKIPVDFPSITWSQAVMETPGVFGPKPWILGGPCSWISGTASWGGGPSYTRMSMGMGIGSIDWTYPVPGWVIGKDIGFDLMAGVSIPLYMNTTD